MREPDQPSTTRSNRVVDRDLIADAHDLSYLAVALLVAFVLVTVLARTV